MNTNNSKTTNKPDSHLETENSSRLDNNGFSYNSPFVIFRRESNQKLEHLPNELFSITYQAISFLEHVCRKYLIGKLERSIFNFDYCHEELKGLCVCNYELSLKMYPLFTLYEQTSSSDAAHFFNENGSSHHIAVHSALNSFVSQILNCDQDEGSETDLFSLEAGQFDFRFYKIVVTALEELCGQGSNYLNQREYFDSEFRRVRSELHYETFKVNEFLASFELLNDLGSASDMPGQNVDLKNAPPIEVLKESMPRYTPPNCRYCKTRMRVASTRPTIRILKCDSCGKSLMIHRV